MRIVMAAPSTPPPARSQTELALEQVGGERWAVDALSRARKRQRQVALAEPLAVHVGDQRM